VVLSINFNSLVAVFGKAGFYRISMGTSNEKNKDEG
jgi:hypothetical protein